MAKYCLIGDGGAGCRILDSILNINDGYNGYYVNSNGNEVKVLDNATNNNSIIMDKLGMGANRDRDKAKNSYKADQGKIINFFSDRISDYDCAFIFTSSNGGWGSGTTFLLAEDLKTMNPRIKISLVATLPKQNASKTELVNTLQFYNELIDCKYIDSYIYVDNNKMKDEEKFNNIVAEYILDSIEFQYSVIDENDILSLNTSKGYKTILKLNPSIDDIEDAIEYEKQQTPFILPKNILLGSIALISVDKEVYNKSEIEDKFNVRDFIKSDYNELDLNLICVSGCIRPTKPFKDFEVRYNEIKNVDIEFEQEFFKSTVTNNKTVEEYEPTKILNKRELRRRLKGRL